MTQKHEPFGDLPLGEEETYDALAACYDDMTADVDYPAWADFIEALFAGSPRPVHGEPFHTVLDLACGTGTMSFLLAERGYEVIGVDFSPEMLAVAAEKSLEGDGEAPIFLCQSMEELDLYGTVDACVCLLDSVNHVTEPDRLQQALRRVWLFLEAGGLFVFDVHTPEHLQSLDGGLFDSDENEADIKQLMATKAAKIILLADHSKFDSVAFAKLMDLESVDVLVTDRRPSEAWVDALAAANVQLLCPEMI